MDYYDKVDLSLFKKGNNWRMKLGALIYYFSEPAKKMENLKFKAYVHKAQSPGSCLTQVEIKELASFMLDVQELDIRREYFEGRAIEKTFQGLMQPLVGWLIKYDSSITSILNIGAHYAYSDRIIAMQHPHISFLSVDFAPNLRSFNKEFILDNLDFKTGYALEMLESNEVCAKVITMSSTATVIKNLELKRYIQYVANSGKYLIFNEPLYNLPAGGVVNPTSISTSESLPAFQYQMSDGSDGSLCYSHNYKDLVEEAGMEVLYYKVFRPVFTDLRMVQLIAKSLPI